MARRAARINRDEVSRMIKAVIGCGLTVGRVTFDGEKVSIVIGGDIGENRTPAIDGGFDLETVQDFDGYKSWRDRIHAHEDHGDT